MTYGLLHVIHVLQTSSRPFLAKGAGPSELFFFFLKFNAIPFLFLLSVPQPSVHMIITRCVRYMIITRCVRYMIITRCVRYMIITRCVRYRLQTRLSSCSAMVVGWSAYRCLNLQK